MGFFKKMHQRAEAKMDAARQDAIARAQQQGASPEQATAAGDKAARKVRRRRLAIIVGVSPGGH